MKYYLTLLMPFLCFSQTIWDGPEITFTKANNINAQDNITDEVSITRLILVDQYSILSLKVIIYSRGTSPLGTLWAIGNLSDNNLAFNDFRSFDGDNKNKPPRHQFWF